MARAFPGSLGVKRLAALAGLGGLGSPAALAAQHSDSTPAQPLAEVRCVDRRAPAHGPARPPARAPPAPRRRQGLQLPDGAPVSAAPRHRRGDPDALGPARQPGVRPAGLPPAQHRGARGRLAQGEPAARDALREARGQLPRHGEARDDPALPPAAPFTRQSLATASGWRPRTDSGPRSPCSPAWRGRAGRPTAGPRRSTTRRDRRPRWAGCESRGSRAPGRSPARARHLT